MAKTDLAKVVRPSCIGFDPTHRDSSSRSQVPMSKENNCQCVVCQVEKSLLDSLNTQTARIHFQALASNHPILNHFDSPEDVIVQLHDHEEAEVVNHNAWNGILHALVDSIADGTGEEIGQQLLLVAYAPAIHKVYRDICQKFPGLCSDDIAQQAAVCFLEAARSPEIQSLNGHLPAALVRRFRQSLFRWAIGELRQSRPLQEMSDNIPEPEASNFEKGVALEHFLSKSQRMGVLSATECELVRKFHCEGFQPVELRQGEHGPSAIALYYRVQRAVHRLRLLGAARPITGTQTSSLPQPRKSSTKALEFSGEMCTRNSMKGFSPEPSHHVPQVEPDMPQIAA